MCSGLIGVPLGMWLSQRLKSQYEQADPLICAFGLLTSAPLLFLASCTASYNVVICYTLMFFGEVFLNLNWSIVADILLVRCYTLCDNLSTLFLFFYYAESLRYSALLRYYLE